MNNNSLFDYTPEEFNNAYALALEGTIAGIEPSPTPYYAILMGGQPGSGKSYVIRHILTKDQNLAFINLDDYRIFHPRFKQICTAYGDASVDFTQDFAAKIVHRLVDELKEAKYNFLIEGTLRTAEVPLESCRKLKSEGYEVELLVVAVNKATSWQSTIDRYIDMELIGEIPRNTDKSFHDYIVKVLPGNLEEIYNANEFDRITLYDREMNCLYDSKITPNINPRTILESVLHGQIKGKEKGSFAGIKDLRNKPRESMLEKIRNLKESAQESKSGDGMSRDER
jgi:UDP-N-acetylglucosamine kinase